MHCTVGILVFDSAEVLDFTGPYEVFTTASRVHRRIAPTTPEIFRVCTIGATGASVRARAGLLVQPDFTFDDHPPLDVLVVPGGVVTGVLAQPRVTDWIATVAADASAGFLNFIPPPFLNDRSGPHTDWFRWTPFPRNWTSSISSLYCSASSFCASFPLPFLPPPPLASAARM